MKSIEITSWSVGCRTIAAIKLIREMAGLRLDLAKDIIEHVLAGESVTFPVPNTADDAHLASELSSLGFATHVVGTLASVA